MKKLHIIPLLLSVTLLFGCSVGGSSNNSNNSGGNGGTTGDNNNTGENNNSGGNDNNNNNDDNGSSSGENNNSGNNGQNSGSENQDGNQDEEPLPAIDYVKVFAESANYSHVYAWTVSDGKTTELVGKWPGTNLKEYDSTWLTYDFEGYTALNFIFSKGGNG